MTGSHLGGHATCARTLIVSVLDLAPAGARQVLKLVIVFLKTFEECVRPRCVIRPRGSGEFRRKRREACDAADRHERDFRRSSHTRHRVAEGASGMKVSPAQMPPSCLYESLSPRVCRLATQLRGREVDAEGAVALGEAPEHWPQRGGHAREEVCERCVRPVDDAPSDEEVAAPRLDGREGGGHLCLGVVVVLYVHEPRGRVRADDEGAI
mmetsp:Transcript_3079/g.10126  ORF Transcript_3079/g.10126 Transcript_3079/m.10126 type:complete len:210 (-) Transcript_3079:1372-2001(-)